MSRFTGKLSLDFENNSPIFPPFAMLYSKQDERHETTAPYHTAQMRLGNVLVMPNEHQFNR